jgi:hypothetical protein
MFCVLSSDDYYILISIYFPIMKWWSMAIVHGYEWDEILSFSIWHMTASRAREKEKRTLPSDDRRAEEVGKKSLSECEWLHKMNERTNEVTQSLATVSNSEKNRSRQSTDCSDNYSNYTDSPLSAQRQVRQTREAI